MLTSARAETINLHQHIQDTAKYLLFKLTSLKKTVFFIFVFCFSITVCQGQTSINSSAPAADTAKNIAATPVPPRPVYKPKVKKIKPIRHELSFGIRLNTDGWSFFSDLGKVKTDDEKRSDMFHNVRLWQFEIAEKKNPSGSKKQIQTRLQGQGTGQKVNPIHIWKSE